MTSRRGQLGGLLALLGLALLVWGALRGDLRVGLFLIVPYVYGTGLLPFLGFVLLMVGGFLWLTGRFERVAGWDPADPSEPPGPGWAAPRGPEGEVRSRAKHGGFVLLGPIPIVWGNDRRALPWLLLLGVALFALMLALPFLLR